MQTTVFVSFSGNTCKDVFGYKITYKSTHQIDDIYFSMSGVRTIPVMTGTTSEGCTITQPGSCNNGAQSPWDSSGTTDNSGCWSFNTHSILCDHDIRADKIHIHFWSDGYASTSGYTVEALNTNGDVVDMVLDVGTRNGVDAEDSLPNDCIGKM